MRQPIEVCHPSTNENEYKRSEIANCVAQLFIYQSDIIAESETQYFQGNVIVTGYSEMVVLPNF